MVIFNHKRQCNKNEDTLALSSIFGWKKECKYQINIESLIKIIADAVVEI